MPRVINKKREGWVDGAVYVGRPSIYGNPFGISKYRSREQVIELYRRHVLSLPNLLATIKQELRGKDLMCSCAPKPCHADVLLQIANEG